MFNARVTTEMNRSQTLRPSQHPGDALDRWFDDATVRHIQVDQIGVVLDKV